MSEMSSLGAYLRERRERRGVSLEEIARVTRVNVHYLEALERDDFAALPAPVFVKGFVRAYCQCLGEAPEEALARYDGRAGPAAAPASRVAAAASARRAADGSRRGTVLLSFVLLVVLGVALFVVTLVLESGRSGAGRRPRLTAEPPAPAPAAARPAPGAGAAVPVVRPAASTSEPAPVAPVAPPAAVPPPVAAPTPAPAPALSASPAPAALPVEAVARGVSAPYRLVARTSEPTWIRVRTEDGRSTEETIPAGEVREWVSNRPFVVTVGNAGGVTLELNGRVLPPLGARGAVVPRLVLPPPQQ